MCLEVNYVISICRLISIIKNKRKFVIVHCVCPEMWYLYLFNKNRALQLNNNKIAKKKQDVYPAF